MHKIAHPGAYLEGALCHAPNPPPLGDGTKQQSTKYMLKSRDQIIKRMQAKKAYATWHFSIILISLRVEVAQISELLVHAIILPLLKSFFDLNLPHSTLGKKDIAHIFYI